MALNGDKKLVTSGAQAASSTVKGFCVTALLFINIETL
jgi:hypothetical protein